MAADWGDIPTIPELKPVTLDQVRDPAARAIFEEILAGWKRLRRVAQVARSAGEDGGVANHDHDASTAGHGGIQTNDRHDGTIIIDVSVGAPAATTDQVRIKAVDNGAGNTSWYCAPEAGNTLRYGNSILDSVSGNLTVDAAATLNIGTSTQTTLSIGRVAADTTVRGLAATVTATTTNILGDTSIAVSAPTVTLGTIAGAIVYFSGGTSAATTRWYEASGGGTNYVGWKAADALSANLDYTWPSSAPTRDNALFVSTTAGVTSWLLISSLTQTDVALGDSLILSDASASNDHIRQTIDRIAGFINPGIAGGRLTLTSGTYVTTTDVTGATSIYYTPGQADTGGHDKIAIFDGTRWIEYTFTELTFSLGTLVNAQAYDLFIYDNSGTLTLESAEWANATVTMTIASPCVVTWTSHGMATSDSITFTTTGALPTGLSVNTQYWITKVDANTFKLSTSLANVDAGTFINTSGTQSGTHTGHQPQARQTALTTQNGVLVKSGATTRRLLGSFMTTTTTTTEDSATKRFLSNAMNAVPRRLLRLEDTNSWNYTTAAYRQANASASNQVQILQCLPSHWMDLEVRVAPSNTDVGIGTFVAIGEESTTTPMNSLLGIWSATPRAATIAVFAAAWLHAYRPSVGYHNYLWLEYSQAIGTTTWWGDAGAPDQLQSGMGGWILG